MSQPGPSASASEPSQGVISSNSSLEIKKGKDSVFDLQSLQTHQIMLTNAYTCVPHPSCIQPAVSNGLGSVGSLLPSFVSAVLVVIGWYVVNKAQSNRERRKQIREYISDLCDDLEELEALAILYHTAIRDESKESEIISKLGRFEKACSTLPRFLQSQKYFKAVPYKKLIIDGQCLQVLRKAITLNHFGDEHTRALSRQDTHIQNLELASVEVQEVLERVRIDSLD